MRKISWPFLLSGAVLCANFSAVQAQNVESPSDAKSATSSTRFSAKSDKNGAKTSVSNSVSAPTYAQLKRSLKIDPSLSLDAVRADQASFAGRAVEFSGFVTGTVKANGVRTAILNVDGTVVRLQIADDVLNNSLLQSGAAVRVLALVGANDQNASNASSAVALQPLAISAALKAQFQSDNAPQNAPYALDELPAATEIPLVQSARGGRDYTRDNGATTRVLRPAGTSAGAKSSTRNAVRSASGLPASSASSSSSVTVSGGDEIAIAQDNSGDFEAQMPAYRAMVKRFNPKLRDDIVEKIASSLLQAGTANGMDPRFLAAIISIESDFDVYCRSDSGAMGLGQLMPFNLKEAHITNAWDPVQNVWGTARLLRGHLKDYRDRADGTLLAVAAYNAGPGAVRRAGYRVPAGSQVQRYVWKVYNRYKEFAPDMFDK